MELFKTFIIRLSNDNNHLINLAMVVTKSKFELLMFFSENMFYLDLDKEQNFNIFNKAQIMYYGFSKLLQLYKWKKSCRYNNVDLYMNFFLKESNVIKIRQNKFLYLFSRCDLIKLLNASLSHSEHLFSIPLVCKNPYNNIPFSTASLYNIYYFLRAGNIALSDLIHAYYNSNFDLKQFLFDNEYIIKKQNIRCFIKNSSPDALRYYIIEMLILYSDIYIHKDFCVKKLISSMLIYLEPYMMISYAFESKHLINRNKLKLRCDLREFKRKNPSFGRFI